MENTHESQPGHKLADQASLIGVLSSEQEHKAYDYQGQKKSVVGHLAVIRSPPHKFELKDRVKMEVEEYVEGIGRVVSYPIFTIKNYIEDPQLGWTYQLFDVDSNELYMGGQYYEEAKLSKERRRR